MIELIKIILGVIVILFLPGYIWSYVFFKKEELDGPILWNENNTYELASYIAFLLSIGVCDNILKK